jgi:hypothetical protein
VSLAIERVLLDRIDLRRMSGFWRSALNLEHVWTGPFGGYVLVDTLGTTGLALMLGGNGKAGKNRAHLDLRPGNHKARFSTWRRWGRFGSASVSEMSHGSLWLTRKVTGAVQLRITRGVRWCHTAGW